MIEMDILHWLGWLVAVLGLLTILLIIIVALIEKVINYWLFSKVDRQLLWRGMEIARDEAEKQKKANVK